MTESRKNRVRDTLLRSRDNALTQLGRTMREVNPLTRETIARGWFDAALQNAADLDWFDEQMRVVEEPGKPQ